MNYNTAGKCTSCHNSKYPDITGDNCQGNDIKFVDQFLQIVYVILHVYFCSNVHIKIFCIWFILFNIQLYNTEKDSIVCHDINFLVLIIRLH